MHVLAIGSDRSLFLLGSESGKRQIAYAQQCGELSVIVFSLATQHYAPTTLAARVRIVPTSSRSRIAYIWDACRVGRKLEKPDVITAQDPFESGLTGVFLSWWHKAPLHVQVHTDFLSPEFVRGSFLNRVRRHIARVVLPRAQGIRVVSKRIADSLQATHYRLQTTPAVLPIFVDIARYRDAVPGDRAERFKQCKKKIVIVSRLEPEKNVALAIRAFKEAAPSDACLIIVGDGSERRKLEKLANEQVFFEGIQDAAPYYALADLVLVTSMYEGYGRATIEALAAGKPVLSRDVGIAREAGALIAGEDFAMSLRAWFNDGQRVGALMNYPYASFDGYVEAYCADISACIES